MKKIPCEKIDQDHIGETVTFCLHHPKTKPWCVPLVLTEENRRSFSGTAVGIVRKQKPTFIPSAAETAQKGEMKLNCALISTDLERHKVVLLYSMNGTVRRRRRKAYLLIQVDMSKKVHAIDLITLQRMVA
ncbi:MAG TPA: hypothetical protein VEC13_00905 [Candidatus Paceibacterota bacterium]|nr:hypothetical protein [Candidatus Paceibacterota bacterium]